jgi:hypothetical protein
LLAQIRSHSSSFFSGLWPGAWTMGNLGRAGFGASVEGLVCPFQLIFQTL